jgi:hypothetical protein
MDFIQQGAPQEVFDRCTALALSDIEMFEQRINELKDEVHLIDVKTKSKIVNRLYSHDWPLFNENEQPQREVKKG